jgi:hypothetical protein
VVGIFVGGLIFSSAVEGVDIFNLRRKLGRIYYSDRFVARVKAAKLKGLDFTKVWSSDK